MTKYIDATATAKIIRGLLKKTFPGIKFSVRTSKSSLHSSIHIKYEDGPALETVRRLVSRFRGNDFDGMQDMSVACEPDTWEGERVRWGCTYAPSVNRKVSIQLASRIATYIRQYWAASVLPTFKLVIDEERGSWCVDGDFDETQIFHEKLNGTDAGDPLDIEADRLRENQRLERERQEYEEQRAQEQAAAEQHAAKRAQQVAAVRAVMAGVECREVTPYFVTAQFSGQDKLETLEEFREELARAIAREGAKACTKRVRICFEIELSLEQF